jgi:hypothetical protein
MYASESMVRYTAQTCPPASTRCPVVFMQVEISSWDELVRFTARLKPGQAAVIDLASPGGVMRVTQPASLAGVSGVTIRGGDTIMVDCAGQEAALNISQ